jgi:extradiol dioxygenase family protein
MQQRSKIAVVAHNCVSAMIAGKPGEQWTMFFKDPSGNNLEFKALTNPANLFAKYYVD